MKLTINKNYIYFYITLYEILMIFYSFFSPLIVTVFQLINNIIILILLRRYYSVSITLLFMMIINVPLSFISILGTDISSLPVSWFILYSIFLFIRCLLVNNLNINTIILAILLIVYLILNFILLNLSLDGFKQLLMIILFLMSFIIGQNLSSKPKDCGINHNLNIIYIYSTFAASVQIFIQYYFINNFDTIIGNFSLYGGGRSAYSGLFNDNSFVGIYIASGILLAIINLLDKKKRSMSTIIIIIVNSYALLLCSSRTGLYALIVVLTLYLTKNSLKGNLKAIFISILITLLIPSILEYMLNSRGGTLFDDSGRINDYISAFTYIKDNIFFGIGLGLDHLENITNNIVPHNFFIQYLLQLGLVGTLLITLYCMQLLKIKSSTLIYIVLFIVISSMVIPDIVSSRFFSVIIIMYYIEGNKKKRTKQKGLDYARFN